MLIEPDIDKLKDKVESPYELVHLVSQRSRDIIRSAYKERKWKGTQNLPLDHGPKVPPLTEDPFERPVSQAAREVEADFIGYTLPESSPAKPIVSYVGRGVIEITDAMIMHRYMISDGINNISVEINEKGKCDVSYGGIAAIFKKGQLTISGLATGCSYDVCAYKLPSRENSRESDASPATNVEVK